MTDWRDSVEQIRKPDGWIVKFRNGDAIVTAAHKLSKPDAEHLVRVLKEFTKDA